MMTSRTTVDAEFQVKNGRTLKQRIIVVSKAT